LILFHKFIASGLGIGLIGKGSGTIAAGILCILWYVLCCRVNNTFFLPVMALIIILLGIWSSSAVEQYWGKDSRWVVIDEIAGMCVSLLFLKTSLACIVIGFILFRFFDIAKPLFIKKTENLPGGYGVMMDDVLAGIYTNILLHLAVRLKIF
jgi:phosphatidylglycerophosphatase A